MKAFKLIALAALAAGFAAVTSCGCCTSDPESIPLRPAPNFAPIHATK